MIAIPRADGGIEITGSLQCPYYVHTALARALALPLEKVVVIQEETGRRIRRQGGVPLHAGDPRVSPRPQGRSAGADDLRPPRGPRRDDEAPPAVVRHRTGVAADGRLVAQDIDVVIDAGAYTTLSPVVLSRGGIHATGPYRCPNVRVRARAAMTNTSPPARSAASARRRRSSRPRPTSTGSPRRWASRRSRSAGATPTARATSPPTGQVLRESVAALDVLERAEAAAQFERNGRGRPGARARAPDRVGDRARARLARRGVHRVRREATRQRGSRRADGRRANPDPLAANTEMGQGSGTVLGQVVAEALGVAADAVDGGRPTPRASRTPGPPSPRAPRCWPAGSWRRRPRTSERTWRRARAARSPSRTGPTPCPRPTRATSTSTASRASSGTERLPGRRVSGLQLGVRRGRVVDVDLDTGEVRPVRRWSAADAGRIVNTVLAEGQVEGGTLQAVGYATIEEVQVVEDGATATTGWPRTSSRRRSTHRGSRRILLERPFRGVPAWAKGLGELPMDVARPGRDGGDPRRDRRLDRGPAGDPPRGARGDPGGRGAGAARPAGRRHRTAPSSASRERRRPRCAASA